MRVAVWTRFIARNQNDVRGFQGCQLGKHRQLTGEASYLHQHRPDQNAVGDANIEAAETAFSGGKILIRPPTWTINGRGRAKPSEFVQLDEQSATGLARRLFAQWKLDSGPRI